MVYGVAIIAIMLAAPEGLFWTFRDRFFRRAPAAAADPRPRAAARRAGRRGDVARRRGLSQSFGGLRAVQDVSFSVAAGEILGIIGPNGAGKTTLFNLLNGVLRADAGTALLAGGRAARAQGAPGRRRASGAPSRWCAASRVCSLLDNVIVGAYGAGPSDDVATAGAAEAALEAVGLADRAARPAGELTNKELRLMELARALAGSPRLLLLDETLAGLGREECDERARRAARLARTRHDHRHHRAHDARDAAARRSFPGARPRQGAGGTAQPRAVMENPAVIEAYLGTKFLARQHA